MSEPVADKEQNKASKKRQVYIISSILILLGLLLVFVFNYYRAETVKNRFISALENEQVQELKRVAFHKDGTRLTKGEAQALLDLYQISELHETDHQVVKTKPLLFFIPRHQMQIKSYYATYDEWFEGLTMTFNGEEIPIHNKVNNHLEYGPLAPGVYDIAATYRGVEGEGGGEEKIILSKNTTEPITIALDVSTVVFVVEDIEDLGADNITVKWNDQMYRVSAEGETNRIGPIVLDGSEVVQVVASLPWGDIETDPIPVTESRVNLSVDPLAYGEETSVEERILQFSEGYVEALTSGQTKKLEGAHKDVKTQIDREIKQMESAYSDSELLARVDYIKLAQDKEATEFSEDSMTVHYDLLIELEDESNYEPNLKSKEKLQETYRVKVALTYEEDEEAWEVLDIEPLEQFNQDVDSIVRLEGSGVFYELNQEYVQSHSVDSEIDAGTEKAIEELFEDYLEAESKMQSKHDIEEIEHFLTADAPRYQQALTELTGAKKDRAKKNLKTFKIETITELDDSMYEVTTLATYEAKNKKKATTKYETITQVKQLGKHGFKVYNEIEKNVVE